MISDEQILKDQMKIIQYISQGHPLSQALSVITKRMEKAFHSCEIYTAFFCVDSLKNKLIELTGVFLPMNDTDRSHLVEIGPNGGPSSSAAFYEKTIFISGMKYEEDWDGFRNIAQKYGIKASWSKPIYSTEKELLGVFSIYFKNKYKPDEKTKQTVKRYNQLAAIALELSNNIRRERKKKTHPLQDEENKQLDTVKILPQLIRGLMNDEFELYYQPYFEIGTKYIGMEALIRWNHPDYGKLKPASFLDTAEATGFIINMEEWVLNRSILEAKRLRRKSGKHLYLSVNISARQFENKKFPIMVTDILETHLFNPKHLTLEITERFLINQGNIEVMNELKSTGIRLSIDDFGTSYSSLQYLKDLPLDELKIDRSFISDIESDVNTKRIVEMVIKLGQELNLTVVGEGVETRKQFEMLSEMNCNRVQGFLFSKPLPFKKFAQNYEEKWN